MSMSKDSSKKSSTDENTDSVRVDGFPEEDTTSNGTGDNIDQEEVEDIVIEETETVSGFSSSGEKKLREKLKKAVEEKQEYLAGWQRAKADLVNAKKDFAEERKKIVNRAHEDFVLDLLPVFDSFDMAFKNKEAWEAVDPSWRVGVEYIHNQLHTIMNENGVSRIEAEGQKFDPRLHVSVEVKETDDESKDDIIERIVHNGYVKGEKILRPAQVIVYGYGEGRKENGEAQGLN